MDPNKITEYLPKAQHMANQFVAVLNTRNMPAPIKRAGIGSHNGNVYLFINLDPGKLPNLVKHTSTDLKNHLKAVTGAPVAITVDSGIWFAFLVHQRRQLKRIIGPVNFPGWRKGKLLLGQAYGGQAVTVDWADLDHVLIAGATGSGKTNLARLIAHQAIQENFMVGIVDHKKTGFAHLAKNPNLIGGQIAHDLGDSETVVAIFHHELENRKNLFVDSEHSGVPPSTIDGYNLFNDPPMPRWFLFVDEINTILAMAGGPGGRLGQMLLELANQGRQFGLHLVLSGQNFQRVVIGFIRDQCTLRFCFRVTERSTSLLTVNTAAGTRLKNPGNVICNQIGELQIYLLPDELIKSEDPETGLDPEEERLARELIQKHAGKLTYSALRDLGIGQSRAGVLREDWLKRGLAEIRPAENNAWFLTEETVRRLNTNEN